MTTLSLSHLRILGFTVLGMVIWCQSSSSDAQELPKQLPSVQLPYPGPFVTVIPTPNQAPTSTGSNPARLMPLPHDNSPDDNTLSISTIDLTVAYARDAEGARKRYAGKMLKVEGRVWGHNTENELLTYVVLEGHPRKTYDVNNQCCWLVCLFADNQPEISTLRPGEMVRIVGRCNGDLLDTDGTRLIFTGHHLIRNP